MRSIRGTRAYQKTNILCVDPYQWACVGVPKLSEFELLMHACVGGVGKRPSPNPIRNGMGVPFMTMVTKHTLPGGGCRLNWGHREVLDGLRGNVVE